LINNAIQATRELPGEHHIAIVAEAPSGKWLRLHVDDDGPGIPEELRPTIFDPYVTHTAGGTGLGLAIVKKIVVEHGGAIDVGASPLGGARITITLPSSTAAESHARSLESSGAARPFANLA
jgi:signal transduction histidine kinase